MNNKSNLLLFILFALAICVVGWLGFQLASQQEQQLKISQLNRSEQTLLLMQNNINSYIKTQHDNLADLAEVNFNAINNRLTSDPLLNDVMVFSPSDQLLFPLNISLERQKHSYLWLENMADNGEDPRAKQTESGWFVWYDQQKEKYIFWLKNQQKKVFVEINNAMFMAEFMHWLSTQPNISNQAYLYISDNQGRIFYQWGDDKFNQADINIQKNLNAPLTGWNLHFHSNIESLSSLSKNLFQVLVIGLLLLMSIITYVLFQLKRREQLEAQQRLSFINQVSHELKTPLTNIRLHGELLERTLKPEPNNANTKQSIAIIKQESERLTRLINNVLNFNSLEKQSLKITPVEIAFPELIEQSVRPFKPSFENLHINILIENEIQNQVHVDIDIVKQIIGNLLSNIEKYAANSAQITLKAQQEAAVITITVQDQGSGISNKHSEKIFEPFYRISSDLTHAAGSGLGLGLARDLARLHGGDLKLIPNKSGACFELTIKDSYA